MSNVVTVEVDNGIAVITVNNPPVNTITESVRIGLNDALDEIATTQNIQSVLLLCEGSTYFSGADINEFNGPPKEAEYRDLFLRLENINVPVVTAMYGTVMGGGLEIALACHYRLADELTRFAFPEVGLGIFPGAGGTQRMPRLIGIERTLEMVIGTKPISVVEAMDWGFLDKVVNGDLRAQALDYCRELIAGDKPPRPTSANEVAPINESVVEQYKTQAQKQFPHQSAGLAAVEVICASATLPFLEGLQYEDDKVNIEKQTEACKGYIHGFFASRKTSFVPGLNPNLKPAEIKQAAIIGAGTMGGGIAMCFANVGIPVTIIDVSQEGLTRGLEVIDKNYASRVKRGRMTEEKKADTMKFISGALNYDAVKEADVVIEAVFEDLDLKRSIFKEIDKLAKPSAVLATNTSTLDINKIAAVTSRPENVIGMHFFSPANVMPLLEVVRTDTTSDQTICTTMAMAKPLRKTPVLAKVCYGFIGNRMMEGYAREAEFMALEGATPRKVDDALQEFGMAMGILAVFDMAGVDVGVNVHKANAEQFPPDPAYYQASQAMYDAGRMGQKNGKGFYRYEAGDRNRYDDEEALQLLRERAQELGIAQRSDHSYAEITERCIFPLINDAIRILDEGVAIRASDIDVVWAMGYGFPRYRGGPLFYAETIGLKTVYDGILKYQAKFGSMHWQPAPLLARLVEENRSLAEWESERQSR